MKTVKSNFTGVTFDYNNGHPVWRCRVQRKTLRFKKNFPFTELGELKAAETYKKQIEKIKN
jgi:hypothetical protein